MIITIPKITMSKIVYESLITKEIKTPYVTCQLMGGLGNQLFIIFTTIAYSNKNKIPFYLPNYQGSKSIDNKTDRPSYWNNFFIFLKQFIIEKEKEGNVIFQRNLNQPIKERNIKLSGYFQDYRYFWKESGKIKDLIGLSRFQELYQSRYKTKDTISIHFRIGDYRKSPIKHPILPLEYYQKSLDYLIKKTGKKDWVIRFCCEDQNIKEVLSKIKILKKKFPQLYFRRLDRRLEDWEILIYMSICQHNIIANSSFSWWGAFLNKNKNLVCLPSKWFGGEKNMLELTLPDWKVIPIY